MNILAQIFGTIAIILSFKSYQCKKRCSFLTLQTLVNVFYGIQYLLLNAYSGGVTSLISIIKNLSFYGYVRNDKKVPVYVLIIMESIFIMTGILTYDGLISIIPVLISCFYTWAGWQNSLKTTCVAGMISAALWIIYNAYAGAYVSLIASVIEIIGSTIGFIKHKKSDKTENNKSDRKV